MPQILLSSAALQSSSKHFPGTRNWEETAVCRGGASSCWLAPRWHVGQGHDWLCMPLECLPDSLDFQIFHLKGWHMAASQHGLMSAQLVHQDIPEGPILCNSPALLQLQCSPEVRYLKEPSVTLTPPRPPAQDAGQAFPPIPCTFTVVSSLPHICDT